jgi:hypothetical protein
VSKNGLCQSYFGTTTHKLAPVVEDMHLLDYQYLLSLLGAPGEDSIVSRHKEISPKRRPKTLEK